VPALLTIARLPCTEMPLAWSPTVMTAPARLLMVLSSFYGDDAGRRPKGGDDSDGTGVRHLAVAGDEDFPRHSSTTVMTPVAVLVIVLLFTPAKMPVPDDPAA